MDSIKALTIEADHRATNHHQNAQSEVDLQLLHSDGSVVALFADVQV